MRKLVLEEILLMSSSERAGKKIVFHPETTVLLGENGTGKSSLLKSVYWTFGAEPAVLHPEWNNLNVVSLVRFSVDGTQYSLLRQKNFFAIFDAQEKLINTFTSITKELGPYLAELFNFHITLADHKGENITPPPAYYFLPFTIDQDASWANSWAGFSNLKQIPYWKSPIIEYHLGLKTDADYDLKLRKDSVSKSIQTVNAERRVYERAYEEVSKEEDSGRFEMDIEQFKEEIKELLDNVAKLQALEDKLKPELSELLNRKNSVNSQIEIVERAVEETRNDYEFATNHSEIDCPTCGQAYKNSFAERFSIAKDEYRCVELLSELRLEFIEIEKELAKKQEQYNKNHKVLLDIEITLAKKKGDLSLGEVIQSEGRKQMRNFVKGKLAELDSKLGSFTIELKSIEADQRKLANAEKVRKTQIMDLYLEKMGSYLSELDVSLLKDFYKDVRFPIKETGSIRPRALLAYYFAVLQVIKEFSSSVFAPIIIDTPKQQDLDKSNWKAVLSFIKDRRVEGSQLILAVSDLDEVKFEGKVINMHDKRALLSKKDFSDIFSTISPFLDKSLLK